MAYNITLKKGRKTKTICVNPAECPDLLAFAESVANNTGGNLHGFHFRLVERAREIVKKYNGKLDKVGRYQKGIVTAQPVPRFNRSRWLPTSKTCSNCGCKKDVLALSERIFHCEHCGFDIDRDLNAARNIHTASCAVINACGDGSPGPGARKRTRTKLPSTKQELDRTMQMSTN